MKKTPSRIEVADICLYGSSEASGWLVMVSLAVRPGDRPTMFGDGEPAFYRNHTTSVWEALDALRAAGITDGVVTVYEPSGRFMATVPLDWRGYFGSLPWTRAKVYTISAEAILAAAAPCGEGVGK